jgi:hypothetical protein
VQEFTRVHTALFALHPSPELMSELGLAGLEQFVAMKLKLLPLASQPQHAPHLKALPG